jgi:hypothetical protein
VEAYAKIRIKIRSTPGAHHECWQVDINVLFNLSLVFNDDASLLLWSPLMEPVRRLPPDVVNVCDTCRRVGMSRCNEPNDDRSSLCKMSTIRIVCSIDFNLATNIHTWMYIWR